MRCKNILAFKTQRICMKIFKRQFILSRFLKMLFEFSINLAEQTCKFDI